VNWFEGFGILARSQLIPPYRTGAEHLVRVRTAYRLIAVAAHLIRSLTAKKIEPVEPIVYSPTIDLGPRQFGERVEQSIKVQNTGSKDIVLSRFSTSCSCAGVEHRVAGQLRRVDSVLVAAGEEKELVVRIGVGGKLGAGQAVAVSFATDAPHQPRGSILLTIPRVEGGIYVEPAAVSAGTLEIGETYRKVVEIYDNGMANVQINKVVASRPERFSVRQLPLTEEARRKTHEIAGSLVSSIEVTAKSESEGLLLGEIQVFANGSPTPSAIVPVFGCVRARMLATPSFLVLPYWCGREVRYQDSVVIEDRLGKAIRGEVTRVPSGLKVELTAVASRLDQIRVIVGLVQTSERLVLNDKACAVQITISGEGWTKAIEIPIKTFSLEDSP